MLIPLRSPLTLAVSCFQIEISVTDTEYKKVGSKDVQSIVANRKIKAAVNNANARKLENIFGGSVSDGSLAIYTKDILYFSDILNIPVERQLQTYFTYGQFSYRVAGIDPWHQATGINIYLALRHVKQDLI